MVDDDMGEVEISSSETFMPVTGLKAVRFTFICFVPIVEIVGWMWLAMGNGYNCVGPFRLSNPRIN